MYRMLFIPLLKIMSQQTMETPDISGLETEAVDVLLGDRELFELLYTSSRSLITNFGVSVQASRPNDLTDATLARIQSVVVGMTNYRNWKLNTAQIEIVTLAIYARSQFEELIIQPDPELVDSLNNHPDTDFAIPAPNRAPKGAPTDSAVAA